MGAYLRFLMSSQARTVAEIAQQPGHTGTQALFTPATAHHLLEVLHADGGQGPGTQHTFDRLHPLLIRFRCDLLEDFSHQLRLLLVQGPADQQQVDHQTGSLYLFQAQDMHLQKRLHAFKEQFNLPAGAVESQDQRIGPVLLAERRHDHHPFCPPQGLVFELLAFGSRLGRFALTCPLRLVFGQMEEDHSHGCPLPLPGRLIHPERLVLSP